MKTISIIALLLICVSWSKESKRDINDKRSCEHPSKEKAFKTDSDTMVAKAFMNEYVSYCLNIMARRTNVSSDEWVANNQLLTLSFKTAYREIVEDAIKADPEMGLGFDPIYDAQDFPDSGFAISKRYSDRVFIELKGINWPEFKVTVKTLKINDKWFVDGAGIINIPEPKRAKR